MLKASWAIATLACLPVLAHADALATDKSSSPSSGFYIGGTVGQSELTLSTPGVEDASTNETGFKILGGYSFNENFAVEVAYYNPGEVRESEDGLTMRLNADFIQGSVLGRYPINDRLFVTGRVGFSHWESKLYATDGFNSGTLEDDNNDFNFGIGAVARVTDRVDVRLEWDQTKINSSIGALPVDFRLRFLQVGATFKF